MEVSQPKNRTHPLSTLMRIIPRVCSFLLPGFNQKRLLKTKHRCFITLRNRQKPLCLHIAECFGHWRNKKHSSHAGMTNRGMTNGCFRAGESVITESSSPTMRQMGKKLTRNMLRDALSLSQNWNCGNKYKRGLYICEYIHIIYIIYIYIYYVYINTNRHSWKQNAPFWLEKKKSFARQNNKQKVSGVYVFIHIYIYTYIHIKSYEWMNQTFPVSSRRSKFVQRLTLNKYIFFFNPHEWVVLLHHGHRDVCHIHII